MPQLMPLFWILSNVFVLMFLLIMILIYNFNLMKVFKMKFFLKNYLYVWCW